MPRYKLKSNSIENVLKLCKDNELKEWLDVKETVTAMSSKGGQYFGMALRRKLVVMQLGMKTVGGVLKDKARRPFRKFETSECEGNITTLCWVRAGKSKSDQMLLSVGTDSGFLLLVSCKGALLHRQNLNTSEPVVSIHTRQTDNQTEGLIILLHPTTVVSVGGNCISKLVTHNHSDPTDQQGSEGRTKVSFILSASPLLSDGLTCNVHKLKPPFGMGDKKKHIISDVVPVGKLSTSVLDVYNKNKTFHMATVGSSPSLAGYSATLDEPVTASNLAKRITKTAVNMVFTSIGSRLWGAPAEEPSEQNEPKIPKPVKIEPTHVFNDPERTLDKAVPNSTGRYLAVADSLGRVSILDTTLFVIIKMLKGYREATIVWLDHQSESSCGIQSTFLVYLPRRGIIEAWRTHSPQRLAAMKIGFHCRLLDCRVQCCVLQTDGMISSIGLETIESEAIPEDSNYHQLVTSTSDIIRKWKSLFSKTNIDDLPSEVEYFDMLQSIHNSVDLLECVISVPDSVPIHIQRKVTDCALQALDKRGSNLEEIMFQNNDYTDTEKSVSTCEAMRTFKRLDNMQTERNRLLSESSPELDEGRVFRYLVNRASVLSAYELLTKIITNCSEDNNIPAVVENTIEIRNAWESATSEHNAEMLLSISTPTTLLPEVIPLSVFASYFDMLGRATVITAVDRKLADFICFPMTQNFESFGKCCHMLSLSSASIIKLLIIWGERGGDALLSLSFDKIGRLASGALSEFILDSEESNSTGIPVWLGELSNFNSLQLISTLIIAAISRTEPETESRAILSRWLSRCIGFFELRVLLRKRSEIASWITHLSISSLEELPPAAIVAAAFLRSDVSKNESVFEYLNARDGVKTLNAHTAMFLTYVYLKHNWNNAAGSNGGYKLSTSECWLGIANSLDDNQGDEIQEAVRILTENDCDFRSIQWCAAAMLHPIHNMLSIARSRRVTISAVCRDVGKSINFVQEHTNKSLVFLDMLHSEVRTPSTTPDTSSLNPSGRWWGNFSFDDVLVKLADSDVSFTKLKQIKSLLQFISITLDSNIRVLSIFDEKATLHWNWLFPAAALKMQLVDETSEVIKSEISEEMMRKREELIGDCIRTVATVEEIFIVVDRLKGSLQVSNESSSLNLLSRLYFEGQDKIASDYLDNNDVEVPNRTHCLLMLKVIKLRLRSVLSLPMAGGTTQQLSERSLNLMSTFPLDLADWIDSHDATEEEEAIVMQWVHSVPCVTACHRLKVCFHYYFIIINENDNKKNFNNRI